MFIQVRNNPYKIQPMPSTLAIVLEGIASLKKPEVKKSIPIKTHTREINIEMIKNILLKELFRIKLLQGKNNRAKII